MASGKKVLFYFDGGSDANTSIDLSDSGDLTDELAICRVCNILMNGHQDPRLDDGEC